jgi:hypothetical protein
MYNRRSNLGTMRGRSLSAREACLLTLVGPERRPAKIEFLIDTLPIRIAFNSFTCIAGVHSNRHSSEAWNLYQKWAARRDNILDFDGGIGEPLNDIELRGAA